MACRVEHHTHTLLWLVIGDDGPGDPDSARQAVSLQVDDLVWWATTLRSGRHRVLEAAW